MVIIRSEMLAFTFFLPSEMVKIDWKPDGMFSLTWACDAPIFSLFFNWSSIDVASDGQGNSIPYELFNKNYEEAVLRSWADLCNRSVKREFIFIIPWLDVPPDQIYVR